MASAALAHNPVCFTQEKENTCPLLLIRRRRDVILTDFTISMLRYTYNYDNTNTTVHHHEVDALTAQF